MEQTSKKGFQWFKTLSKKQQKQFRINCHRQGGIDRLTYNMNGVDDSKFSFIISAFSWGSSPQGHSYWHKIALSK